MRATKNRIIGFLTAAWMYSNWWIIFFSELHARLIVAGVYKNTLGVIYHGWVLCYA